MTATSRRDWRTTPRICQSCNGEFLPRHKNDVDCDWCWALRSHRARARLLDQSASRPVEVDPDECLEYVTAWFERAEKRAMAATEFAKTAKLSQRSEQRHLLRCAIGRARWTLSVLQRLEALYPDALRETTGLEVVEGLAEDVSAPKMPGLTVVRDGGAR